MAREGLARVARARKRRMERAIATRITTSMKTGQERRKQKKRPRLEVIRKRNLRRDKDTEEQEEEKDKVVYLTDEDIEDLLK